MEKKLEKVLAKFDPDEKLVIKELLLRINQRNWQGLDLKKLKGRAASFRVRKGRLRIIFTDKSGEIKIQSVQRRDSKTYRNF